MGDRVKPIRGWEIVPCLLVAAVLAALMVWTLTSVNQRTDFNPLYNGATQAWQHGDPWLERINDALPGAMLFLAPLTALPEPQAAQLWAFVNLALAISLLAAAHLWLRRRTAPWFAWVGTLALSAWSPLVGTVWWGQVNLVALTLGVAGFALATRRPGRAGALIGVSLAVKPLLLVLPLFLLARRTTRWAGVASIAGAASFTALGLAALAWHGGSANPWAYYQKWTYYTSSPYPGWLACHPANQALSSIACQAFGTEHYTLMRLLILPGLAVIVLLIVWMSRRMVPDSLLVLAWPALLSALFSPVYFHHYAIFLAPMLVWLAAAGFASPRRIWLWAGLAVGWCLTQLVWAPAISVPARVSGWLGFGSVRVDDVIGMLHPYAVAPWVLLVTAVLSRYRIYRPVALIGVRPAGDARRVASETDAGTRSP